MHCNKFFFFSYIIFFSLQNVFSLDLTADFNISNMGLDLDKTSSQMASVWGTFISAEQKINNDFLFNAAVFVDDVTGNRLDTSLTFLSKYFILGAGPSIAFFNDSQYQLKPAINAFALFKKEGSFFLSTGYYTTLGNLSNPDSDYSQVMTHISFGLTIPGAICTFSIENKQFSWFETDSSSTVSKTTDTYSIYQMEADIYKKNIPFHILIAMGYKEIQRIYPVDDSEGRSSAGVGSLFIGAGTIINFNNNKIFKVRLDSGLYNFTLSDEIAITELPDYLFNLKASFTYRF
jgi:hypothetical protein